MNGYLIKNSSAKLFNQDILLWDVSSVVNMHKMFYRASLFNQDIGLWIISRDATLDRIFD